MCASWAPRHGAATTEVQNHVAQVKKPRQNIVLLIHVTDAVRTRFARGIRKIKSKKLLLYVERVITDLKILNEKTTKEDERTNPPKEDERT